MGIPDLWEKWTHGKKLVADSDLDRDGDGLTDLEEFWNQTDPRTADTDGDSFSDAFEVANGMNPVVSEDFTPVEPDANNNGLPDIWEQVGYTSSFYDANSNGFDDIYEAYDFPAATDSNFDVVVDVYTTRSALIVWESGESWNSIVILPSTSTSVKLRLPFGADTALTLLPAPYGTDLPSGELWKAKLGLSFLPRAGQNTAGTCIISAEGGISQKVVGQTSVITRFPDAPTSMQMRSLDGESTDAEWPRIQILQKSFEIVPETKLFHGGEITVGSFSIVNTINIDPASVTWHASHGSMSPSTGDSSSLIVGSIPGGDMPIIITAKVELDEMFSAEDTAEVRLCGHEDFSFDAYTSNFSPHLGETHITSVRLPGCIHHNDPGWLEIEVMRETTEGWQHVAWIDMDSSTSGVDRFGDATQLSHHSLLFWDGIATEGAAAAEAPAVFTAGTTSFHRSLPQVVSGEPVPPPYYTTFVRLWNDGKNVILEEESRTFYVPQVVKIEMTDAAYNEFKKPILYPGTFYPEHLGDPLIVGCESNVVLYAGCADRTKAELLEQISALGQALYPGNVNIRFTASGVAGRYKTIHVQCDYTDDAPLGLTMTYPVVFPNAVPIGTAYVNMNVIRKDSSEEKLRFENKAMESFVAAVCEVPTLFPFSVNNLAHAVASTVAHEIGHHLSLVNEGYLGGTQTKHNRNTVINGWMMNNGAYTPCVYHLGSHSNRMRSWNTLNAQYLQFILPKGDQ